MPRVFINLLLCLFAVVAWGQSATKQVVWSAKVEPGTMRPGEYGKVVLTATVANNWHIYSVAKPPADGPFPTQATLAEGTQGIELVGALREPTPERKFDANFQMDVGTHHGTVKFEQPFKLLAAKAGPLKFQMTVAAQACDQSVCMRPAYEPQDIEVIVENGPARPEHSTPPADPEPSPEPKESGSSGAAKDATALQIQQAKSQGLLSFMWLAFGAGLLALLTPCVFPMIPITVSFFAKKHGEVERPTNLKGATAYSLGIIGSFTLVGLVTTILFGASGLQQLAANAWVNLFLAGLFVFLALNLFGLFELQMPQWLVSKFSKGAGKEGIAGPILMGVTFSLTTFTCTVPFVGTLLLAATQGDYLYPTLGMFAFSLAFALPFFFLALFPQLLAKMPKSGSWLSTVKAFMGFLELAAALKFLSNIDLVNQWGLITRPVFLSIWSTLMVLASLYLFGWILLGHDGNKPTVGWIRRGFAAASLACALWFLSGLQGSNLGTLGSFLPPDPYPGREKSTTSKDELSWNETLDEAIAEAKSSGKPVFIDFTGVTCTNCRQMEQQVFPKPTVREQLSRFARAKLYTDRPEDAKNAAIQQKLTQSSALPIYVILDPSFTKPVAIFAGSQTTPEEFAKFLSDGFDRVQSGPQ